MIKKLLLLLPLFLTTAVVAMETSEQIAQKYIYLQPLCTAIAKNKVDKVKQLFAKGADARAALPETGDTPLHIALEATPHNWEILALLLQHGADQTAKNKKGHTPLESAVYLWRNEEMVKAAGNKHSEQELADLLAQGTNPNYIPRQGCPAIHAAISCRNIDKVGLLLKYGADATQKNGMGDTTLHTLLRTPQAKSACIPLAQMLLDAGALLTERGRNKMTPIETAEDFENHELAEFFKSYHKKE